MKRALLFALVVALCLVATPHLADRGSAPSKSSLFGVQLQACQQAYAAGTPSKCKLYGKIKMVEHHEDVKIKAVQHHEDIKIKWVEHFADRPGRWKSVEHHEDFKVKFVEHHEDYKVKFVEHHEGCD